MTPRRPDAAVLMEHQAFLTRLARSLVFDDQRADDIVQDSFVVALERPAPAPEGLRGWLAGIVRNSARRVLRSERRMRDRNRRGARPEALSSAADMAARLEAQRVIAAAVESLDEPGRSALVYRYFDGHKPARIARDLAIPLRTVESRLRRARASLRQVLDGQFGDRGTWQLALVPLLGAAPAAVSVGGAAGASSATSAATGATSTALGVTIMSANTTAIIALVAALAGAGLAWALKPAPEPTYDEEPRVRVVPEVESARPELGTDAAFATAARARAAKLTAAVEEARAENARLRAELAVARTETTPPSNADDHLAAAKALKVPRFRYEKFDDGLLKIDWKSTAAAIRALSPLIPEFAKALSEGRQDPQVVARMQELNAPLIQVAMTLKGAQVPGDGYNGPFTHPSVTVNAVYATLIDAGMPLDDAQSEKLRAVGDQFVAEEVAMRLRVAAEPFALARFLEESNLKDRLYQAIDSIVTPEQRVILHPEALRDRVQTDLFSTGLIWIGHLDAARGARREDIAARVVKGAMRSFQISEADQPAVERAVGDWLRAFDNASIAPLDIFEEKNFIRMDRVRRASPPMLALYKELAREMSAQPAVVKRIQDSAYVMLPVLNAK